MKRSLKTFLKCIPHLLFLGRILLYLITFKEPYIEIWFIFIDAPWGLVDYLLHALLTNFFGELSILHFICYGLLGAIWWFVISYFFIKWNLEKKKKQI